LGAKGEKKETCPLPRSRGEDKSASLILRGTNVRRRGLWGISTNKATANITERFQNKEGSQFDQKPFGLGGGTGPTLHHPENKDEKNKEKEVPLPEDNCEKKACGFRAVGWSMNA